MYMKCFEWPSAVKLLAVLMMSSVLPVDVLQHICETAHFTFRVTPVAETITVSAHVVNQQSHIRSAQ